MFAVPSAFLVTEKTDRDDAEPPVRSFAATIHPLELVSVWLAGTGVKALVPSALSRLVLWPVRKEVADGQVGPAGGLVIQSTSDRRYVPAELKTFTPMSRKSWVSPSLG